MNRNIKFRAWNKNSKSMFNPLYHDFYHFDEICDMHDKYHVMQFTGLYDRYGKEIYEGDILNMCRSKDTIGQDIVSWNFTVEWQENFDNVGFEIPFIKTAIVIGNIHETPELLTN